MKKQLSTSNSDRTVLVCQSRSCKSCGSAKVLQAFQTYSITQTTIIGSGCLGKCGNGPMVLILPQEIWYDRVFLDRVQAIVKRHLL